MELAKRFEIGASDADQAPIHPVDAFAEQAKRLFPNEPLSQETLDRMRAYMDEPVPAEPIGDGIVWTEDDCYVAPESGEQTEIVASNPYENVEPGQTVHTVSPEVGEVLQAQAKRIADLEVMNEAQRTLTANAVADVERQQAGERARRIELEQVSRARKWAIDALIEALVPFASYASEEDGNIRGMTEPVCLSMAAVRRADALVKLHQALR